MVGITQGQIKPYSSIPRIDWANQDTAGLTTYCYDTGSAIVDLINGTQITTIGVLASQQSPFGPAMKFPLTGYGYMPPLPLGKAAKFGGTNPFSAAMGTLFTGTTGPSFPDSACVTVQDAGNSEDTGFGFNTWPPGDPTTPNKVSCVFGNTTNAWFSPSMVPNTYQSWAVAAQAGSAQLYADGKSDSAFSGITTFSLARPQIMYNTASINAGQTFGNGINGFAPPYFAMWDRLITVDTALRMHQNPWSVLIYPEQEFATIGLTPGYLITVTYKVLGVSKQVSLGISPNEFPDQATAILDAISRVSAYRAARGETITNVAAVVSQIR